MGHRTLLDGHVLPIARRPVGRSYVLVAEPMDAHPEVEADLLSETLGRGPRTPLYYDVSE